MLWFLGELCPKGWEGAILEAQAHALGLYERLGFTVEGPEFLDAGIPHRAMRLASAPPRAASWPEGDRPGGDRGLERAALPKVHAADR